MTISQTTPEKISPGESFCPQCQAALPPRATFCSSCGERLQRKRQATLIDDQIIKHRYRITTLVRKRPYINLYFAIDKRQVQTTGELRMVAMRALDLSHLSKETKKTAIAQVQEEYDLLRRDPIPHTLASIDLRLSQGRLFLVSALPALSEELPMNSSEETLESRVQQLYTLQDFLQSGQGLPTEARSLTWICNLCQAIEKLHSQQVILGDLDPYTVVLDKNSVEADPKLMVFWLLPALQTLLPQNAPESSMRVSYFSSPEALEGKAEIRSDIYSLGALLYLLLTGTPPTESTRSQQKRLRSPREINSRISQYVDECVMQALSIDPAQRFASVAELLRALQNTRFRARPRLITETALPPLDEPPGDADTVRIIPLSQKDVVRWRRARTERMGRDELADQPTQQIAPVNIAPPVSQALPPVNNSVSTSQVLPPADNNVSTSQALPPADNNVSTSQALPPANNNVNSGALPTQEEFPSLPNTPLPEKDSSELNLTELAVQSIGQGEHNTSLPAPKSAWRQRITGFLSAPAAKPEAHKAEASLLKRFQRLILGQHHHQIEAAAVIETPVRIRPDQSYSLRMHIMGRNELMPISHVEPGGEIAGLSALVQGEVVLVEVRSILQQGYTYMLQRATLTIPASGYEAEVTIPMQPQSSASIGSRNRLYVFFLDDQRRPLYEKPFVIEIFVSPLVQFGKEGHQVLTIPI